MKKMKNTATTIATSAQSKKVQIKGTPLREGNRNTSATTTHTNTHTKREHLGVVFKLKRPIVNGLGHGDVYHLRRIVTYVSTGI